MQNHEVNKVIDSLKGKKSYEEKKATKLGFSSLYAYIEDKILKQKKAVEDKKLELAKVNNKSNTEKNNKKKSCSCC